MAGEVNKLQIEMDRNRFCELTKMETVPKYLF